MGFLLEFDKIPPIEYPEASVCAINSLFAEKSGYCNTDGEIRHCFKLSKDCRHRVSQIKGTPFLHNWYKGNAFSANLVNLD